MVRREQLDEARRRRLMDAAVEEFAERGFDGASYNKIIERSGISKGTVYYYFDNKEALLSTVLEDICDRFLDVMGKMELPETVAQYWETERKYRERAIFFFLEKPSLMRVIFMLHGIGPGSGKYMQEGMRLMCERTSDLTLRLLERGQQIGAVRTDISLKTLQRLAHMMSEILCLEVLDGDALKNKNDEEIRSMVKSVIPMINDLTARILVPGGYGDV